MQRESTGDQARHARSRPDIAPAPGFDPISRYRTLLDLVHNERFLLLRLDVWCMTVNVVIQLFVALLLLAFPAQLELIHEPADSNPMARALVLLVVIGGMGLCANWLTQSLRLQLRLKLRYFQTRDMERSIAGVGVSTLSDEGTFFSGRVLTSSDGRESIEYPRSLDGAMGRFKARMWSWFLPGLFFAGYSYIVAILLAGA